MEMWEMKNADDVTGYRLLKQPGEEFPGKEFEIERDVLLNMLFDTIKNEVEFIFNNSVTALNETKENIEVIFKDGSQRSFDLVFGCDGIHSAVRRIWFGNETEYSHFLGQYFSITIVNKLLIKENTLQMYGEPNKGVMLYAYNNKTDIVLSFRPPKEIPYDYRNEEQQRKIILEQFKAVGWRTAELLKEVMNSKTFYFDKYCQIKMPSWTKGRVALVGDAAYCASPAAGKGGSLAIDGAAALADTFQKHNGNYELAFEDYNKIFGSYIDEVQAQAVDILELLLPRTEEAIRKLYEEGFGF
jgi:2-polyprenyl-6-methoxyphenol hydroxylase-like FAD-dependent oxidoreductase